MATGYLNLVLHAHLPFVYNTNDPHYLEERWFFEAVTDSYLPLLIMLDRLHAEQIPGALTVSLSPTLLTMLDHPILSKRYVDYLKRLIRLSESEVTRTKGQEFHDLALFYLARHNRLYEAYTERYQGDLPSAFAAAAQRGQLELITTCATHAFLPLIKKREAVKAQIGVGLDSFAARFGFKPHGMWLPECGYFPGLDMILAENEVRYVFLDTHGVLHAVPTPQDDVYAPVKTKAGVAFFARDPETSAQVWSIGSGYPGDYDYREYYRDIGFDLPKDYIRSFLPYNVPVNTGLKYYRVTGGGRQKEVYRPEIAYAKTAQHAGNFHFNREKQIEHWAAITNNPPVITAPYDAELFGHWWFEGPEFIEEVVRKASKNTNIFVLGTPSSYLNTYGCTETVELYHSSWGEGGYSRVWLNPSNDWLYPEYHSAEERMVFHAAAIPAAGTQERRVLNQLVRELLLAQSSDWAFMINAGTTVEYAKKRVNSHLENIRQLETMLETGMTNQEELAAMEEAPLSLFPDINPAEYAPKQHCTVTGRQNGPPVLMLSWEYPPQIMGGLARHIDDLSQSLLNRGQAVSILTSQHVSTPVFEMNGNICVYRVAPYQKAGEEIDFHDWVVQLNLVFFNLAQKIIPNNPYTILHAHDWLVGAAALAMRRAWHLPLVATIHATEHGRNGGIFSPLQHKIHRQEKYLVEQADRVICCSKYMANEIVQLFSIPAEKVRVVQNGVVPENIIAEPFKGLQRQLYANDEEFIIFFVGRLVKEKGVEVLLEALPYVFEAVPNTKAIISGKGPMLEELAAQAKERGIADKVMFTGFISDIERNRLFATADVAVFPSFYEPFGIVALEAMAAGVPVVVSDVGGMGEVVEYEKDGLKIPPGNAKELAEAVVSLLSDRALRERLEKEGRLKAATVYSWDLAAGMTADIYRQVWEEHTGKL
jgi:1,4-alpha-glucan branching enzyme